MHFVHYGDLWTRMGLLLLLSLLNASVVFPDSVNTRERKVTKVAEGIYVIRHPDAPDTFPQGNTTVIIGDREVLVVDSCYLPSDARKDIAQIRQWTDKPVRYLLNTHRHRDHTLANGVYADAFPSLAIIAHIDTGKLVEGFLRAAILDMYPKRTAEFKQMLQTGKEENGSTMTETRKAEMATIIAGREQVQAEFKNIVIRPPDLMFTNELNIDIGNREVQIKSLGRGHTAGDTIVYLPKEKILIAGDLLAHPVPYLSGGYPSELITTLQRMSQLDAQTIIPGHGEVLQGNEGKSYLNQVIDFVGIVVAQVEKEINRLGYNSRNLEAVRTSVQKAVDLPAWRKRFAGVDKDNIEFFDGFSFPGLVTTAYAEAWRR